MKVIVYFSYDNLGLIRVGHLISICSNTLSRVWPYVHFLLVWWCLNNLL